MKAHIGHIGLNMPNAEAMSFWRELVTFLSFKVLEDSGSHFDASDGTSYLCIAVADSRFVGDGYHRKRIGLSHVAFNVGTPEEVDAFVTEYLAPRDIRPLYGGPSLYADYGPRYYAVYFEDPTRLKVEIAFDPDSA
jgi:catechol 2,3-dioxygenase-like lactoylglutathione lyase family enzyme